MSPSLPRTRLERKQISGPGFAVFGICLIAGIAGSQLANKRPEPVLAGALIGV